eukprot:TRINITY_DN2308_c0_g1_i1.p1 TRINITY_DN2308_c0_g1~~TRINITY_DN2308_c0_g1_i1.p1  ORF type:complete len:374 (+),score=116.86 TRINITY_DN2308_c0_g1_i1:87-1208(+)
MCDLRAASTTSLDDLQTVDDVRIKRLQPLLPPSILLDDLPLTAKAEDTVVAGREAVYKVVRGKDDRLIAIVGPCSIHDPEAALEYARKLKVLADELVNDILIVMRVYFEKPRTTVGWKGLINDPNLDGSFMINKGIRMGRDLLVKVNELGLPCGCEFLDTITPQFFADLVSWGAIGARTTESQIHRELASGLSMSIGFKNGTSGDLDIACDAVMAAKSPHSFLSVTKQGLAAIVHTRGNPYCTVILRGGKDGPNYSPEHVADAVKAMATRGVMHRKVIIDCSHGNSLKQHKNQPVVAEAVGKQVAEGQKAIIGVMIESNIVAGAQKHSIHTGKEGLVYGQSITDACVDFPTTEAMLRKLAEAVQCRRKRPREN